MTLSRVLETPSPFLGSSGLDYSARRSGRSERSVVIPQPVAPLVTAFAVTLLTVVTIRFGMSSGVVVMWLANAVAAAIWARAGRGRIFDLCFAVVVFAALLTGFFLSGYTPIPALTLTGANTIEVLVGVVLLRRFAANRGLATVRSTIVLVGPTVVVAPLIGALLGALVLAALKGLPLLKGFQMWWFGHALGMLLIVPLIMGVDKTATAILKQPVRLLEWAATLGSLTAIAYLCFVLRIGMATFVLNILLVVIAARLRMAGVALSMLIIAVLTFGKLLYGAPPAPLAGQEPSAQIMATQLMMLTICLPFMLVATLLTECDDLSARAKEGRRRAELASEAKSRLLANVAHEIKSPVAGIIGIGELWSSGQLGSVTATQREMADMLTKTARQVEVLAHDLLDVARAESGAVKVELRATNVAGLLEDVRRSTQMRPDARGLDIRVLCEAEGLVVLADSQRLAQVIDNLATNAVKYGASGGIVIFGARRVPGGIRIEVVDNGAGLSPEKQAQLFEPFNRLGLERSSVEGHGIGLALAKRLVQLQGGTIGVESVVGQGSTFWIELPAV